MENKFIKTSDLNTACNLRRFGLVELPREGAFFVFVNDTNKKKENFEKEKLVYSNKLCF